MHNPFCYRSPPQTPVSIVVAQAIGIAARVLAIFSKCALKSLDDLAPPSAVSRMISATAVPRPYHRRSAGLPVCSTPWPATVFDVALAFLSLVLLSPVLLDLARKSACPTCALYCGDPHGPI